MRKIPAETRPAPWRAVLPALVVAAVGLVAYHNSWHGVLLLDDHPTLENNDSIRHLWSWRVLMPPPTVGTAGRPLSNLTFAINYAAGGMNLWGYHAINLIVHLATALFILGIVRRTLQLPRGETGMARSATVLGTLAAALWVAHPLTTETVTYLSQRTEALAAAGWAATLYCMIRYATGRKAGWAVAGVIACAAGMASKETAVTAPVAAFLYDAVFVAGSARRAWAERGRWYLALALCWGLLAVLLAIAHLGVRGVGFSQGVSAWAYALGECRAVLTYLKLSVWPHPLVFDYGWPSPVSAVAAAAAAIVVLGGAAWCAGLAWRGRWRGWFGLCWLLMLAPTSSIVPIVDQPIAENRTYLPLAVVISGLLLAGYRLVGPRVLAPAAAAMVALVALTIHRNQLYQSESGPWSDVLTAHAASPRALNSLGMLALKSGDLPRAIALVERALALRPDYPEAQGNLGAALLSAGRAAEAVPHFRSALALEPNLRGLRTNLGNALLAAGDVTAARRELEQAARADAGEPESHLSFGRALAQSGATERAIAEYRTALQLNPHHIDARIALGNLLLRTHDPAGARTEYEAALREDPAQPFAHNNLAFALVQLGQPAAGLEHATEALRLRPRYAAAHGNAANALLQLGRLDEAIGEFRAALALDPRNEATYNGLGIALARRGRPDEAVAQFRAALRIDPHYAPAANNLKELERERAAAASPRAPESH